MNKDQTTVDMLKVWLLHNVCDLIEGDDELLSDDSIADFVDRLSFDNLYLLLFKAGQRVETTIEKDRGDDEA
jgi:hypothetical protein